MRICMWCDVKEVTTEVSYRPVMEDTIACCDECFDVHYRGDEDLQHIIIL